MTSSSKSLKIGLYIMALSAVITGFYPAIFGFIPETRGLFTTKPEWLLNSSWYVPVFMIHISFGGIAILSGSTQFFDRLRLKKIGLHRTLGKVYVLSVVPSGITGFIVGFYATGTWFSKAGFIGLAIGWLLCTMIAYATIRNGKIPLHKKWMMRSYAFCFAFVTFRIYLGLGAALGIPFYDYYSYLAFLSWVPNLLFIEYRIKNLNLNEY